MLNYQVNDNFSVRLNVYNLADERYIDRVGGGHFVPGPGRSAAIVSQLPITGWGIGAGFNRLDRPPLLIEGESPLESGGLSRYV